jgi:23S rRNA pseudouridine1911/1915/1917 synthase
LLNNHQKKFGNAVYFKKLVDSLFGQMLHARKIGFVHTRTHEYMEFTCEPPEKFLDILEMYKDK